MGTTWTEEMLTRAVELRKRNTSWKVIATELGNVDPHQLQVAVHRFKHKGYIPEPRKNLADYVGVRRMFVEERKTLTQIARQYGVSAPRISVMLDRLGLTADVRKAYRDRWAAEGKR